MREYQHEFGKAAAEQMFKTLFHKRMKNKMIEEQKYSR